MASLLRRSSVLTCQIVQKCTSRNISNTVQNVSKHKSRQLISTGGMTRNLCGSKHVILSQTLQKNCNCRGLQTEGDAEFSKFLQSEIKYAKENDTSTPVDLKGWHITSDGADVTLSKTSGNETIKILFNVNNTVDEEQPQDVKAGQEQNEDQVKMVSKPPFTVEIKKSSGKILSAHCTFGEADDINSQLEGEAVDDLFTIDEVAIHDGEWKDTTFSTSSDTMDGTLYDMLMDMLHDRGIGDDFVRDLMEFSTNYEQEKYVDFLEQMKSFVEEK